MELYHLTNRIWVYPFEEERDRPNLSYIRGDRWSLAIDAGHSAAHTREFYHALEGEGLPLPTLTVLTHWHWDHTLGMHAVHGLTLAGRRTNAHLADFRQKIQAEGTGAFFSMHESIRREYANGQPVTVTLADLIYDGEMGLDAGSCPVRLFSAEAPHTDDSTLIHVPGEGVLFLGDAAGGGFPTWEKDAEKSRKLADTITRIGADIILDSHWTPQTLEEALADLLDTP